MTLIFNNLFPEKTFLMDFEEGVENSGKFWKMRGIIVKPINSTFLLISDYITHLPAHPLINTQMKIHTKKYFLLLQC